MKTGRTRPLMTLSCLFCLVAVLVRLTGTVKIDDQLPVQSKLPDKIGDWIGVTPFYCQNKECGIALPTGPDQAEPLRCPKCGFVVDAISLAEKNILPNDTIIIKKSYHDRLSNRWISVSVVISGSQRGSIHRPEWCLPGQGFRIRGYRKYKVAANSGRPLPVTLLDLDGYERGDIKTKAVFAYWFVSQGREVSSQMERLLYMASDGIIHGVARRWAYVAVLMGLGDVPENEQAPEQRNAFIRELRSCIKSN